MNPLSRKEKLTVRELPGETLVYDLEGHKLHCLNRTAALVWKHCDGRHDLTALAELVARELGLPFAEGEAAVRLALEQLGRRKLLRETVAPPGEAERLTRRSALRKIAVAAAAALPIVMTLRSPSVAWGQQVQSGGCTPNPCPTGTTCQERLNGGKHNSFKSAITGHVCVPATTTPISASCAGKNVGDACGPAGSDCKCISGGQCFSNTTGAC